MSAVKAKVFSGKIAAWLAVLFILLVPMAIGTPVTVAKTPCAHKNRAGENSVAALRLCPAERPQTPDLQQENSTGRYDLALDDTLAAERTVVNEGASPVTGYTWNQVLQARYGAANVEWAAPNIPSTPLTLGVLRTPAGDFEISSGVGGYAGEMPRGAAGFNAYTRTHVEGEAAALMRRQGINEGMLYINNPRICYWCNNNLPYMLQPGRTLQVVLPDGTVVPYVGASK
jgi:hypothetical protein